MKLKWNSLQSTVASALEETGVDLFPNIFYMLSLLAVLPVTSCEAERTTSELGCLKTSLRSGHERLTGLALMIFIMTFQKISYKNILLTIQEE